MKQSDKNHIYLSSLFVFLIILDLLVIGGILWKGHANFPELIKHLKGG